VPEAARLAIFEKFGRASSQGAGGRGFGLYFCRLAVQAHRGRIWVEGQPGDNRFVLELPEPG
jgi:signal transduction histidine kinase